MYKSYYKSRFGNILLTSNDNALTGLWFERSRFYPNDKNYIEKETEVIKNTKLWLDCYFKGISPDFNIPLELIGTDFQIKVWKELLKIPFGYTQTYGKLATSIGDSKMSAQAVGGAVGKNPISIIVPCHRVVGSNGNLTGYAAGVDIKRDLLKLEGILNV